MENVFFEPWVGENYENGGMFGKKVMALGESLYCGGGCPECGKGKADESGNNCWTTQKAVNSILYDYDNCDNWKKTYLKFERSLVNKETEQELRNEIWNSLLFHNYLQIPMDKAREAGSCEDYKTAEKAFFEVLEKYRPEKIIVWGRRLWKKMPGGDLWTESEKIVIEGNSERTGYYTLNDGTKVEVMSVYHPSVGYSWDYWYKFINAFINRNKLENN
nr:hypothetical protein [uncultured Bacteroides sp.]